MRILYDKLNDIFISIFFFLILLILSSPHSNQYRYLPQVEHQCHVMILRPHLMHGPR